MSSPRSSPAATAAPAASPERLTPPLRLALHRVNGRRVQGEAVPLPEEGAVLGSAHLGPLLGLHLDASLHVARNHARIMPLCGHWMLSLADEHMVCAVNGHKVPWGELCTLAPGDSIQLGFTELRVESAESASLAEVGLFAAVPAEASAQGASPDVLQSAAQAYLPDPMDSGLETVEEASASLSLLCLGEAGDVDALCMDERAARSMNAGVHAAVNAHADAGRGTDGDADLNTDEDAGLSPEAALLQQLGTDFAASPTSRALYYQAGQPLDAILAPVVEKPTLTGLVSLLPEEAPSPLAQPPCPSSTPTLGAWEPLASTPAAFASQAASADTFLAATAGSPQAASAAVPTDQDFFAQLAQPQPLHSVLSPPSFSVREDVAAEAAPSLAELLDTQDPGLTLEDIVEGPLHIDDVLRAWGETAPPASDAIFPLTTPQGGMGLGESPNADKNGSMGAGLDVLQQEFPPDPLTLLGGAGSTPASAWDSALSPLLRREHHQADLHTPYTLANAVQAPPKVPHDKEPA